MEALVVDDSAVMRRLQQRALEGLGFTVRTASNGDEALAVLTEHDACRLLLTDWHMPGMDGIELCRRVRADPRFASLCILMVTSEAAITAVEAALAAGATDFLMKPFSADAFAERVNEVLRA